MPTVAGTDIEIYPLALERYEQMVEAGILGPDDRVELLRGVLAAVTPEGVLHACAIQWLTHVLVTGVDPDVAAVRVQQPLHLATVESSPEPDFAVVGPGLHRVHHPDTALLVIEISASSAARDLGEKARIYAEAGIPEYWVVDVRRRVVVVHHDASPEGYREIARAREGLLRARDRRVPPVDLDTLLGDVLTVEG